MARNRDRYGERGNFEEQHRRMERQGGGRYQEGQGRGQHQGERFSGGQQGGWSGTEYGGRGQGGWHGSEQGGRGQEGWGGSEYGERGESGYGQAGEYDQWSRERDYSARGRGRGYEGGFGGYGYAGEREQGRGERGGSERGFWDRASDEVSSWFGDDDAERRRYQDQHRGRGPKGYVRSDERIREDINDRLTDDWSLDATDIDVQVAEREVTLTGEVASRADKRRAEDIAESVSGVTNVQNNLRIKQQSTGGTPSM
ncbi:MAG TPA: BON domain-containing protein [Rhizobiaceae bacterium]|nr:BON domain-containing protein [Rhizobiaceae bacterium]